MAAADLRLKRPIGQMLADQGLVTADQVRIALLEQVKSHRPVGRLMVELGFVPEAALRDVLATTLGLQPVDLAQVIVDPEALQLLPCELARRYRVFPLSYDRAARRLTVALADTRDLAALDQLRAHLGAEMRIEMRLAGDSEIECAIERCYGHDYSIDGILREIETGTPDRPRSAASEEPSQPVIRLISALLAEAVEQGASDVHLEPEQHLLRIRYRIDGVLRPVRSLHPSFWPAMVVRLKVMARMNIAESRAPQDGRISATLAGRRVDFRVASLPTTHGENFVLRVLDRQKGVVPLEQLGLDDAQLQLLQRMLARPEGIILVTGPTGSGKTTTLYSILGHINADGINIMTLEDPVEYAMPSVRQTSVSEASKIDFAGGVRALLRQDPDVILVGEIRDEETAQMAIRAAMTGHQVYSTLHTPSAAAAIPRLLDMGIAPDIMTGNVIGIVAQRLVRRLCRSCRQPHELEEAERRLLGLAPGQAGRCFRATGCDRCDYQGYRGRVAIMEILRVNDGLDELIARRATARELAAAARHAGFRNLADDGVRLVCSGATSLEELARVVDLTERMS
jgi:type II secretory ATPase GspE/PulE/Tfp pilus assembly ATPase PilB-like protein